MIFANDGIPRFEHLYVAAPIKLPESFLSCATTVPHVRQRVFIEPGQSEPESPKEGRDVTTAEANRRAEARIRRVAAVRCVAGIWANRTDIPADGIVYEPELRDEWQNCPLIPITWSIA